MKILESSEDKRMRDGMMRDRTMRRHGPLHVVKVVLIVAVASVVLGFAVRELWNWLMPAIFGLRAITYWQALGLFVLGKLLLGGFHRHGGGGGRQRWGRAMKDRWESMTPEQRERFQAGMRRGRWCEWGQHDGPATAAAAGAGVER